MVDHANVPAVYVLNDDVDLVEARPKWNNLLIEGNTFELLLEQRIRNLQLDIVFDRAAWGRPAIHAGNLDQYMPGKAVDAILLLPGQIFVLQKKCNGRENGVFSDTHKIGSPIKRQYVVRQSRCDDCFQIFVFNLGWLKDVRHQLQPVKRIHSRGVAQGIPNRSAITVQSFCLVDSVELLIPGQARSRHV